MKTQSELRRIVENKLRGLRYMVSIRHDNTVVVEADDDSLERVKRNISGRISGITFINQNHTSRMNWSRMSVRQGIPQMGKEEHKCSVVFELKDEI